MDLNSKAVMWSKLQYRKQFSTRGKAVDIVCLELCEVFDTATQYIKH